MKLRALIGRFATAHPAPADRSEDEQDREFAKRTERLHIASHVCSRCKRRPRMVGLRVCGWCRHEEDRSLARFDDEGSDPYEEQEAVS